MSRKQHVERETAIRVIKHDLLRWTCERHAADRPLDRRLLRDKALELAGEYGLTGFKCSDKWLTCFLRKHGFPDANMMDSSGPILGNYRLWIDMMRPLITRYKYRDLFHLDELTMYTDVSPARIPSATSRAQIVPDATLGRRATVLVCCNASGTEKLPLLICGSYPAVIADKGHVYDHREDATISDELLVEWLGRLNERMSRDDRRILLLLHRDRRSVFSRGLELSNVRHVFFPDYFPPLLRPLKRDVFHFVKMTYRSKYAKEIGEDGGCRWNVENVVRSLTEAWRRVPRALVVASFQRTGFRTDDRFLEIDCDAWDDLRTGVSFRRYVTFDDELSAGATESREHRETPGHDYDLRTGSGIVRSIGDRLDRRRGEILIHDRPRANGNPARIRAEPAGFDRRGRSSLKRSAEEARLGEDRRPRVSNARANDDSIASPGRVSGTREDIVVVSPLSAAKLPRIISVETIDDAAMRQEVAARLARSEVVGSTATADRVRAPETVDDEGRSESGRAPSNEQRSMELPAEVEGDVASQPVFDDAESARVPSAIPGFSPGREPESAGPTEADGNDGPASRGSLKRKRSCAVDAEESQGVPSDGEPERKRSRPDSDWTEQYATTFVFGTSEIARSGALDDDDTLLNEARRPRPRRSCETEKSIFTIRPRSD